MTELEELMALRPLVSELRHSLEQERRDHARTRQERDNAVALIAQLRASLVALRDAHRRDATPPMGTDGVETEETDAVTRRNRTRG